MAGRKRGPTSAGSLGEETERRLLRSGLGAVLLAALALRLVYGWPQPDANRFWDERYGLDNVRALHEEGTFEPASIYYPSPVVSVPPALLVALSETLANRTGDARYDAIDEGRFLPAAYHWTRGLQALYGTVGVLLLYLAGARLFGRAAGYLAALMYAFMGWPIHAGGVFKPGALLTTAVVAAFLASAHQIQRPGWPRAVLTGLLISLAASAKITGAVIAAPLGVVALALGYRDRRQWRDLAISAVTSALAFVALNPYWWALPHFTGVLRRDYRMRAGWEEMSRPQIPAQIFDFVTSPAVLGRFLGVAALLALCLLAGRALGKSASRQERAGAAMVAIFPIGFALAYGSQTAYFKANQFLPILPFLALALAWLGVSLWRRLPMGRMARSRDAVGLGLLGALTLSAAASGGLYVYRALVPTTLDLAGSAIAQHCGAGPRIYLVEEAAWTRGIPWEGSHERACGELTLAAVEALETVGAERLALADGWIFPSARRGFHDKLRRLVAGRSKRSFAMARFEARWLEARGPDLDVVSVWLRRLPDIATSAHGPCGPGCLEGRVPRRPSANEALAFSLRVPLLWDRVGDPEPALEVDGRPVRLLRGMDQSDERTFQSERVRRPRIPFRWVLRVEPPASVPPRVEISRWRPRRLELPPGEGDVMGVGEPVEPGQVDPGEQREGGDDQGDHQHQVPLAK